MQESNSGTLDNRLRSTSKYCSRHKCSTSTVVNKLSPRFNRCNDAGRIGTSASALPSQMSRSRFSKCCNGGNDSNLLPLAQICRNRTFSEKSGKTRKLLKGTQKYCNPVRPEMSPSTLMLFWNSATSVKFEEGGHTSTDCNLLSAAFNFCNALHFDMSGKTLRKLPRTPKTSIPVAAANPEISSSTLSSISTTLTETRESRPKMAFRDGQC
mmetsp:Transcript_79670/g.213030  ORF Transcript_79670/g.213030 Transcript_79670/m.213030 type:complete len:211 (-) Transcript_79670:649-1281(-)